MPSGLPTPDISVCIANYNGGDLVLDCLASVFDQKGAFTLEVIVHDDASTDDSLAGIRRRFPAARTISSDTNSGFCVSNNRLVEASSGSHVLLLNNDAVLRPGSLERLLAFSRRHAGSIVGLPQYSMTDGLLVDKGYCTDPFLNPIPVTESTSHEVGVATGACLWIPRETWTAVGGFPPWFESVAEDIFLCMAARLLGRHVYVLDGPAFDHWVGKNLGGGKVIRGELHTTVRRRALSERNKTFVMLCCYPASALLFVLPLHALLLAFEALFLLATGTAIAKVRRIYMSIPIEIWRRRVELVALRNHLIPQRRINARSLFAFTRWHPRKFLMLIRHGRPNLT